MRLVTVLGGLCIPVLDGERGWMFYTLSGSESVGSPGGRPDPTPFGWSRSGAREQGHDVGDRHQLGLGGPGAVPWPPSQDSLPASTCRLQHVLTSRRALLSGGLAPSPMGGGGGHTGHPPKDKSGKEGSHVSLTPAAEKYQYPEKGTICVQMKHR